MAKTIKSIEQIFELKTENFTYFDKISKKESQYYDAIKNKFELMLSDDKNYDIIAPTGSGKTYTMEGERSSLFLSLVYIICSL